MSVAFFDVDTQVDFIEPHGKLYAQGAETIKENLARLTEHARRAGIPLVSSVDAHRPQDGEFDQYPPHCLKGTPGQEKLSETRSPAMAVVPSFGVRTLPDPKQEHVVLEKQEFDVFTNPNTTAVVKATGADTFYVYGVVTEVCVRHAVLGLLGQGYEVRLVGDAIWPIDFAAGQHAIDEMRTQGAVVVTTEDALKARA